MDSDNWHWRSRGATARSGPGLLYEPGNWGDLLKAAWTARVVAAVRDAAGGRELVLLDPFAGRASWPLSASARERMARVRDVEILPLVEADVTAGRLPSSGALALRAARRGGDALIRVFDVEPEFTATWRAEPAATVLDLADGRDALRALEAGAADFVLVDPYDLFDDWRELLDLSVPLGAGRAVLLYLYNKSPRGDGHAQYYGAFRRALREALASIGGAADAIIGRVPSDARLPRAYHEVVLLGPPSLVDRLRDALRRATIDLALTIGEPGLFEEGAR